MSKSGNEYPIVLVHGFMSYGEEDGVTRLLSSWGFGPGKNAPKTLRKAGYECYAPGLGPIDNIWERACELWYHLVGGTVDYGKVHSEKYGNKRYGRTYEGLIKDWGQEGNHRKVHLIGHSYGAPTARMLVYLLTHGSEEERAGTPDDELSDLFRGGKGDWVSSVTTLAGVNNGTTLATRLGTKGTLAFQTGYLMLVSMLGDSLFNSQLIDFHMEHWDMMTNPEELKRPKLHSPIKKRKQIKKYNQDHENGIVFSMTVENTYKFNQKMEINPEVYYFARPARKSHPGKNGKERMDRGASILAKPIGLLTDVKEYEGLKEEYGWNRETWAAQDGFVNTEGAKAPYSEPHTPYVFGEDLKPGIWYEYDPVSFDHTNFMGMGAKRKTYKNYFLMLAEQCAELPE